MGEEHLRAPEPLKKPHRVKSGVAQMAKYGGLLAGKFLELKGYLPHNTVEQVAPMFRNAESEYVDRDKSLNSFLNLTLSFATITSSNSGALHEVKNSKPESNAIKYQPFLRSRIEPSRIDEINHGKAVRYRDLNTRSKLAWLKTRTALSLLDPHASSGIELIAASGESSRLLQIDPDEKARLHNGVTKRLATAGSGTLLALHTYFEDALLTKFSLTLSDMLGQIPNLGKIPTAAELLALSATGLLCYGENKLVVRNSLKNFDFTEQEGEKDQSPPPEDVYLSMRAMKSVFHKDSNAIRTMVIGAPLGAIYEQLELGGDVSENIERLSKEHAKNFTEIILAITGGLMIAGSSGKAGEIVLDSIYNPPMFGAILTTLFASRKMSDVFHDSRKEPTIPTKIFNKMIPGGIHSDAGSSTQFPDIHSAVAISEEGLSTEDEFRASIRGFLGLESSPASDNFRKRIRPYIHDTPKQADSSSNS